MHLRVKGMLLRFPPQGSNQGPHRSARTSLLAHCSTLITSRPLKLVQAQLADTHHPEIVAQNRDLKGCVLQFVLATGTLGVEERIALTAKQQCDGILLHDSLRL